MSRPASADCRNHAALEQTQWTTPRSFPTSSSARIQRPLTISSQLKAAGITGILNLQTQEDFDYHGVDWSNLRAIYFAQGIEARLVSIRDFDDNELRNKLPEAVGVLGELLDDGHNRLRPLQRRGQPITEHRDQLLALVARLELG